MPDVHAFVDGGTREARVNPHVDEACAHTTGWATGMGMVGPVRDPDRLVLWDRATFDARRYGRFAAHVYPDAPGPMLDLLSDWFVWLWYVDDALELTQRHAGPAAAHRFLTGVAARGPQRRAMVAPPEPTNPAERGADDLWTRTVAVVPEAWCRRFERHTVEMFQEMRAAEANNHSPRMPNPVEYVESRRRFAGTLLSADLVEPAIQVELDDVVDRRPVRQLREVFADAVALRNDVLSYPKEIQAGEAPSNGVAVFQYFLGCDPVTAVRLVGDLRRARLRQFEHVVDHDLPTWFADEGLDAATRDGVERWVEALRDWMAGDVRWAHESGRYGPPVEVGTGTGTGVDAGAVVDAVVAPLRRGPTGLGTAAARLVDCGPAPGAPKLRR